jgi:hypothetical protein
MENIAFSKSSGRVELLRSMFKDTKKPGKRLCERIERRWWKWLILFTLLLVSGGCLTGCSANASAITSPSITPTSQPTVVAGPLHTFVQTFDGVFTIELDITPNRSGFNHFHARAVNNHTHQPAARSTLTLYTTMQDMPMGTDSLALRAGADGEFSATGEVLSMGGHWAIGIVLQTPDHVKHKAGVSFVVPQ